MTLVALTFFNDSYLAISDSRISGSSGPKLEKFPKLFAYPYKFTSGHPIKSPPEIFIGEVGVAFCGSTLFGLAFSNMFARTISEMHAFDVLDAPSFNAFTKIAKHCAGLLCDFVLGKENCFEVLIFGFDPRSGEPKTLHLRLAPGEDGVEVNIHESIICNDRVLSIGSGAKHLPRNLKPPSEVPLEIFVSRVISNKADPATGGDIQIMELNRNHSSFFGSMVDGTSWDDATYFGVKRSDLGDVEGYRVGRNEPVQLKPYGAALSLARKRLNHLKKTTNDVSIPVGNVDKIMSFLNALNRRNEVGWLDQEFPVSKASLISGLYYFSKVCSTCWRNSPSILSPAGAEGFHGKMNGKGSIVTTCQFCDSKIVFFPEDFSRKTQLYEP